MIISTNVVVLPHIRKHFPTIFKEVTHFSNHGI